jgi:flagellar hook-associated protein 2
LQCCGVKTINVALGFPLAVDYLSALNAGSGLNVTQIVDSLVEAERAPKETAIEKAKEEATVAISALGSLKQELSVFKTNSSALDGQFGLTLTSSGAAVSVTRTDNSNASEFSHSISVNQLAKAQVLNFSGFTSITDDLNLDNLELTFGTWNSDNSFSSNSDYSSPTSLSFNSGETSLSEIRDAINNSDSGITAEILEVETGTYSLMVKSLLGSNHELKINSKLSGSNVNVLKYDLTDTSLSDAATEVVAGQNATFAVDGITITRETNTVTDLFNGVNLTLNDTTPSAINISSSYNETEGLQTLQTLVDELNYLVTFLKEQTSPGGEGTDPGALHGDPFVRSLQNKIKSLSTTAILGFDDSSIYLSNFGVMTELDGTLKINETRFKEYFAENPTHLAAVTTSMIRTGDAGVTGSVTTDLYTPGVYNFVLASGNATLDGTTMISGTNRHTITTGDAKGLLVDTTKTSVNTNVYMGRSIVHQLSNYIDTVLSFGGTLSVRVDNFETALENKESELELLNEQMSKQRALYTEKFTAMQTAVSSFKETGKFLDNFIKSMQASNS